MPRISVVTTCTGRDLLDETWRSLLAQSLEDWEWKLVPWGPGHLSTSNLQDPRIRVLDDVRSTSAVRAVELACQRAGGDALVHLRAGDALETNCLAAVDAVLREHDEIGVVYADTSAPISSGRGLASSGAAGNLAWEAVPGSPGGGGLELQRPFEPFPHNVALLRNSPYGLHAIRKAAYARVGGYDASCTSLAEEDLLLRLYEDSPFHHIPERLHRRSVHRPVENPATETMADGVDEARGALYFHHIERLALAWARREGLQCLDLGAAHNKPAGYVGVDLREGLDVDIVTDVAAGIDLPDSSVGVIRASDFLEHVYDKVALFNELHRLLAHGGMLLSTTPSTDGRGAFQDPTHVAFYNQNSFWYFTDRNYSAFVPEITCRFQVSELITQFPTEWHQQQRISYVTANLVALKDGPTQGGICNW
jgi:O-antigen biosynthesis protein